ncbi:MAG: trehalose-phosphatase [Nitrospira sp.]|nr:trehalose-phosphatase [Nitrospira sp.]
MTAHAMRQLFTPAGEADLAAALARRPLLAFDFDGTLAPIVARPSDARVPTATLQRLRRLAHRVPTAVISGRAVDDLRRRLGFEPTHLVGNHGAEDPQRARPELRSSLDGLRRRLLPLVPELQHAGVQVEDKGASLALHYRLARDRGGAMAAIGRVLQPLLGERLHVFGGKMVVNVVSADADDKAAALRHVARRSGVGAVIYLGDDVNDETVFAAREPHWLTIRVGIDAPESAARYCIASPREMPRLLDRILLLTNPA